jgi:hypothetical protein
MTKKEREKNGEAVAPRWTDAIDYLPEQNECAAKAISSKLHAGLGRGAELEMF